MRVGNFRQSPPAHVRVVTPSETLIQVISKEPGDAVKSKVTDPPSVKYRA
jgi:hypothetical protein